MKLITNDETLRQFLPNVFNTAKGETTLFDKVAKQLELAENWVVVNLTSKTVFNSICGYEDDNPTKTITAQLVVADALIRAIPSLDLVLTPNGFGVVANQNIAPASKERIERLIASLRSTREDCIARLLSEIPTTKEWLNSSCARFFGATLFPDFAILEQLGIDKSWENYLATRHKILYIEASLTEEYFSHELMDTLRSEMFADTQRSTHKILIDRIRTQIVAILRDEPIIQQRMMDLVNFIRNHPDGFPEWHNSETAKLFSPPKFENKKESKGYWF